jgi:hypothetical protein
MKMTHSEIVDRVNIDVVVSEYAVSQCNGKENRMGGRHFHDTYLVTTNI